MTTELVFFTEDPSGDQVAVNPRQVRFVKKVDEKRVIIILDENISLTVSGTVAGVADHLKKSAK